MGAQSRPSWRSSHPHKTATVIAFFRLWQDAGVDDATIPCWTVVTHSNLLPLLCLPGPVPPPLLFGCRQQSWPCIVARRQLPFLTGRRASSRVWLKPCTTLSNANRPSIDRPPSWTTLRIPNLNLIASYIISYYYMSENWAIIRIDN